MPIHGPVVLAQRAVAATRSFTTSVPTAITRQQPVGSWSSRPVGVSRADGPARAGNRPRTPAARRRVGDAVPGIRGVVLARGVSTCRGRSPSAPCPCAPGPGAVGGSIAGTDSRTLPLRGQRLRRRGRGAATGAASRPFEPSPVVSPSSMSFLSGPLAGPQVFMTAFGRTGVRNTP
jgi:hypothetical protein